MSRPPRPLFQTWGQGGCWAYRDEEAGTDGFYPLDELCKAWPGDCGSCKCGETRCLRCAIRLGEKWTPKLNFEGSKQLMGLGGRW